MAKYRFLNYKMTSKSRVTSLLETRTVACKIKWETLRNWKRDEWQGWFMTTRDRALSILVHITRGSVSSHLNSKRAVKLNPYFQGSNTLFSEKGKLSVTTMICTLPCRCKASQDNLLSLILTPSAFILLLIASIWRPKPISTIGRAHSTKTNLRTSKKLSGQIYADKEPWEITSKQLSIRRLIATSQTKIWNKTSKMPTQRWEIAFAEKMTSIEAKSRAS